MDDYFLICIRPTPRGGGFPDRENEEAESAAEEIEKDANSYNPTVKPWTGYFQSIEKIEIHKMTLQKETETAKLKPANKYKLIVH